MTDLRLSLSLLLLLLAGCTLPSANHAGTMRGAVRILDSAIQCKASTKEPQAMLINNQEQLQRMASRLRGSILSSSTPALPVIDFRYWRVVYVSAGERPTAGYSLSLNTPPFTVQKGMGRLWLLFHTPKPDALVAAVITHPCVLVQIPAENYSTIEILGLDKRLELTVQKQLSKKQIP